MKQTKIKSLKVLISVFQDRRCCYVKQNKFYFNPNEFDRASESINTYLQNIFEISESHNTR